MLYLSELYIVVDDIILMIIILTYYIYTILLSLGIILLFIQVLYVPYVSNFNDLDTTMRIASKKTCYITTFIMCKFNVKLRHCIVFKIVQHPNVNSILPELSVFCNNCMHLIIVVVVHSGLHNTFVLLLSWRKYPELKLTPLKLCQNRVS